MSIARGLFLAVAGTASLVIACATPWQNTSNLDVSPPSQDNIAIGSASVTGSDAAAPSGSWQASTRAEAPRDADVPTRPPELATLAPRTALGSPNGPSLPASQLPLAQQLQRELARVGCYEGELNGVWTPAVRKAMKVFMDRVNATLPTDEPDYILLSLVQAARDKVCGTTCPAGEGFAEGGRCVPNAILAAKKAPQVARAAPPRADPAPAITGWSVARTPTESTPAPSDDEGRMGLAGPPAAKSPGLADARPGAAGLNAPVQSPAGATAPGAPRPADAKRAAAQPSIFGLAIFKQFEKLGF
jgi:hypothetical protein